MGHCILLGIIAFISFAGTGDAEQWRKWLLFGILTAICYLPGRYSAQAEEKIARDRD